MANYSGFSVGTPWGGWDFHGGQMNSMRNALSSIYGNQISGAVADRGNWLSALVGDRANLMQNETARRIAEMNSQRDRDVANIANRQHELRQSRFNSVLPMFSNVLGSIFPGAASSDSGGGEYRSSLAPRGGPAPTSWGGGVPTTPRAAGGAWGGSGSLPTRGSQPFASPAAGGGGEYQPFGTPGVDTRYASMEGMPTGNMLSTNPLISQSMQDQMLNSAVAGNAAGAQGNMRDYQQGLAARGMSATSPAAQAFSNRNALNQAIANTQARTQIPIQAAQANAGYATAAQNANANMMGAIGSNYGQYHRSRQGYLNPILNALVGFV